MKEESNVEQHREISNFIINKTLHEVGIGFCWPNQTYKQVYQKQIHFGNN